jgi:hypothetical protein
MTWLIDFPKHILPKIPEYTFVKLFTNQYQNSYSILDTKSYSMERAPPIHVKENTYSFFSINTKNMSKPNYISFTYIERFNDFHKEPSYESITFWMTYNDYKYHVKEHILMPVRENTCTQCIPSRYHVELTETVNEKKNEVWKYKNREDGCSFAILYGPDVPKPIYEQYKSFPLNQYHEKK